MQILHGIGLTLIVVQQAELFDFGQFGIVSTHAIGAYTLTQIFVFGAIKWIHEIINKLNFEESPLLVYKYQGEKIETTVAAYDKQQIESTLSTNRYTFIGVMLIFSQLQLLAPASLVILGLLRAVSMATDPLFRIYLLGAAPVGPLERPWNDGEYLLVKVAKNADEKPLQDSNTSNDNQQTGVVEVENLKNKKKNGKK